MYCTRVFKYHEEDEMRSLIHILENAGFPYEIVHGTKSKHMKTTPPKQQFKAVVCWYDIQTDEV